MQVFAAAHELYHLWFSDMKNGEELYSQVLNENTSSDGTINKEDLLANRFAAEFLIQEDIFRNEINQIVPSNCKIGIREIVELMDVFLVPYKTIVTRLYELNYLSDTDYEYYIVPGNLSKEDNVAVWKERLQLCSRNDQRTKITKLNNLVDSAVNLYEKKIITYDKLTYLLELSNLKPKDLGIIKEEITSPSEEELLRMLEEE